jgi:hypothetical protein
LPWPSISPKRFWTGSNCFGQIQKIGFQFEPGAKKRIFNTGFYFLNHLQIENLFCTYPKQFGQVQNHFRPIGGLEGQNNDFPVLFTLYFADLRICELSKPQIHNFFTVM